MKAAVVHEFGKPLSIENVPVPEPGEGQILVKIIACGVCHTDIHAADGDWPVKPKLPFIPGHEGAGYVAAVGKGVTTVKEGDPVGIPWLYVIVWNSWNTAKIGETHRDLAAWPLQMRHLGNFFGMGIRGKLALQNNPLGMHSSTMIVPERTVHRFDQFSRSVNGIVNLRAPVEWFGRCRDACQER